MTRGTRKQLQGWTLLLAFGLACAHCSGAAFTEAPGDADGSSSSSAPPQGDAAPDAGAPGDARPPGDGAPPADATTDAPEPMDATIDGAKPGDGGHDAAPPPADAGSGDGHAGSDASQDAAACSKPCGSLCCTDTEVCCDDPALGETPSCPPIGSLCAGH